MLGLVGEVGELADCVKKNFIYPESKLLEKYPNGITEKVMDEAGDCLWQYMLVLCKYGLTVDEVIAYNVDKLNRRHGGAGKTAADGGGVR